MTNISEMIYAAASADVGTWEWKGTDHNPKVLAYYAESGHPEIKNDEVPWCAAYVGAKLAEVGLIPSGSLMARSYSTWGEEVSLENARQGDIVVLSRGAPPSGHVAFFQGLGAGKVNLLGGNQGNRVSVSAYDKSRIVTIRRAKAPRVSVTETKTTQIAVTQVATGVGTAIAGVASLEGTSQIVAIVAGAVICLFGMWFFRNRLKDFSAGIR